MPPAFFLGLPLASKEEAPRSGGEGAVIVFLKNSLLSFLLRTKVSGYCTRLLFSTFVKVYAIPLLSLFVKVQARVTASAPCFPPFVIRGRASPQATRGGSSNLYHIY